ncbi:restriction endonuclease subunit S [Salinisphaera aquimarina]|uniref:Restriction endonuclease subunit S n=1 Tax=Salinisphaera aquimarina TaxID=2094031 RepID=A0ABV7EMZ0_9GAMM
MNVAANIEGWSHQKIWTSFDIVNGATPASGTLHFWDGDISWVGPADLGKLKSREVFFGERNLTLSGYKSCGTSLVPSGTIILSSRAPIGHVAVAGKELCFNQGCKGLRLKPQMEQSFSYWLVLSLKVRLEAAGQGTTFVELSRNKLKDIDFLLPPLPEQRAIAAFLDGKCATIDEAVRIKQEQITLLQERRQILIQQAVTRGLNPDAPLKDSGIDWIGQIPAHWEVRKVKQIFRLVADASEKNNCHELLSIYTDIGVRPRKDLEERGNKASTTDGYWLVKKGDFIVNKLLAWMGAIGLSEYEGVTSPAYDILRRHVPVSGQFYHRLFRSKSFSLEIKRFSRGIMEMRLRIYFDKLGVMEVPYPPVNEQNKIVAYLEKHEQTIDTAISLKRDQIATIKEYKTSLINAAVTGKIKVV